MRQLKMLFYGAVLIMILGVGLKSVVYADSNTSPAVATNANDEVTIAWNYMGQGNIPTILAKRYDGSGAPIDNAEFPVSSPFAAPSIFNYGPDIATDSANNSVVVWCSYEFSSPGENIKVVYTRLSSPNETSLAEEESQGISILPQQDDEAVEINLFNIPFSPVVAIDSEDNMAIAWSYYDFKTTENGIYLTVVGSDGTAIEPVKVVDNTEYTCGSTTTAGTVVKENDIMQDGGVGYQSVLYHSPSIAFDGAGNITVTWTAAGMLPCIVEGTDLPLRSVFYSTFDTSGSVIEDKETLAIGFNSTVASDSLGYTVFAWNRFNLLTLKTRIMAQMYYASGETTSSEPLEVGVQSEYTLSSYLDNGNHTSIKGMDMAADNNGNFFIAWGGKNTLSSQIYLKAIYGNGSYLSNEVQVSQGFEKNYDPSIATDSQGNVIITWNKSSSSVYARRFDNNLQALGDEFKVNVVY